MYLFFHLVGELLHVVEPCSWVATLKQLNEAYFDFISLTFIQCMQFVTCDISSSKFYDPGA